MEENERCTGVQLNCNRVLDTNQHIHIVYDVNSAAFTNSDRSSSQRVCEIITYQFLKPC